MSTVPDPIDDLERRLTAVELELGIVKGDLISRFIRLNATIAQGFDDMLQEIRSGFTRVDQRFQTAEQRMQRVEERLDVIETILRERGHNGQAQP